jgi:hypothetical protein
VNQGTATVDTSKGGIYLEGPAGAGVNWRIRKKAKTAPYTITAGFIPFLWGNNQRAGCCFRQSSDGKLVMLYFDNVNGYISFTVENWTSETVFSATVLTRTGVPCAAGMSWLRFADDNTNRIVSYSMDGQHFIQLFSVGRTSFLTADEVGFGVYETTNGAKVGMTLLSWKET